MFTAREIEEKTPEVLNIFGRFQKSFDAKHVG